MAKAGVNRHMRLDGKRILVVAATGPTGEAAALLCAQEGARLALVSRRGRDGLSGLMSRAQEAGAAASDIVAIQGDPSTDEGARSLVDQAAEALGGLDGVVYNVGGFVSADIRVEDTPNDAWERMLQQHLTSGFSVLRASLPHLTSSNSGSAVVIGASDWTRQRGNVAYAVAKGAQTPLIRKVASEYREDGVRANLVQPLAIQEQPVELPVRPHRGPLTERPKPEDIAYACVYLLSDESRLVTGQVLTIDGGREL